MGERSISNEAPNVELTTRARFRSRSLHLVDDAALVGFELGLHIVGDRTQPVEERSLVLVDRKPDGCRLLGAVLAIVVLRQRRKPLDLALHGDPRNSIDRR